MTMIMQNVGYAVSFVCLLLGMHLLRAPVVNRTPSILLGLCFLVLSLQSILANLVLLVGRPSVPAIFLPALAVAIGPLLLLYFLSAANQKHRIRLVHGLHFLPSMFIIFELSSGLFFIDIDRIIIASFLVYSLCLFRLALRGSTQFEHLQSHAKVVYYWLLASVAILLASFISEIAILQELAGGRELNSSRALLIAILGKLVAVGFALALILQRPSHLDWIYALDTPLKNAAPTTDAEMQEYADVARLFSRLVSSERLFTDHEVTLKGIAIRLDVTARKLSQSINRIYGESYSRYMNRLRVEAAQQIMRDQSRISITEVMYDSGFRTKSSFNKEFRTITGVSPSHFRDQIQTVAPVND